MRACRPKRKATHPKKVPEVQVRRVLQVCLVRLVLQVCRVRQVRRLRQVCQVRRVLLPVPPDLSAPLDPRARPGR